MSHHNTWYYYFKGEPAGHSPAMFLKNSICIPWLVGSHELFLTLTFCSNIQSQLSFFFGMVNCSVSMDFFSDCIIFWLHQSKYIGSSPDFSWKGTHQDTLGVAKTNQMVNDI